MAGLPLKPRVLFPGQGGRETNVLSALCANSPAVVPFDSVWLFLAGHLTMTVQRRRVPFGVPLLVTMAVTFTTANGSDPYNVTAPIPAATCRGKPQRWGVGAALLTCMATQSDEAA